MCSRVHWGVGFERSRPPPHFPRTILWVVSLNDGRRPRSQRSDVPLRRARARASIDRSIDAVCPPSSAREKERLGKIRATFPVGSKVGIDTRGGEETFLFLTWQIFFLLVFWDVCVCVCSKTDPLPRAKKFSSLSLSLTRTIPLARARHNRKNERRTTSRCSRSFSSCVSTSRFSSYREKRERRIDSRRR